MEGNTKKRMYMDVWLGHFAVEQKLTEHCESTIIKKNKKKRHVKTGHIHHLYLPGFTQVGGRGEIFF